MYLGDSRVKVSRNLNFKTNNTKQVTKKYNKIKKSVKAKFKIRRTTQIKFIQPLKPTYICFDFYRFLNVTQQKNYTNKSF